MTKLIFLGTGGGRFSTIYQIRSTGGLYVQDGLNLHIDPGPSAAHQMHRMKLDPAKTDAVLISHCHPDHYTDAEVMIEGMSRGGLKKRGALLASRSVLEGQQLHGPAISKYHRSLLGRIEMAEAGGEVSLEDMRIRFTATKHSDPTGVGFSIQTSSGLVSYVSDTELDEQVTRQQEGSRVLVLPLTRPWGARIPNHLCTEDALEFVKEIGPEMAILTHFGAKIIHAGADKQATMIEKGTGVRTVAAEDLMTVQLGKSIRVHRSWNNY
ncbi:MAG: MBL fold metallo-hydrolase [Methanomassiliicoccales archaeon]|nr:MBL fold metallo-hydrolase [Methanomassiliicoccales archaeon]